MKEQGARMPASRMSVLSGRMAVWVGLVGGAALAGLSGCTAEVSPGQAGQATGGTSANGGAGSGGTSGVSTVSPECQGAHPGRAPVRRLTRFEYNNAVRDLFGDTSEPANALPPETIGRTGNVFGNDADLLSVSSNLAAQWGTVAEGIATRATATPDALAKLSACASGATPDDACAKGVIDSIASRAYHRDILPAETDSFLALLKGVQARSTFASGVAAVIEAVLQGPEFMYRVEFGAPAADQPELRRHTADEIAKRLS